MGATTYKFYLKRFDENTKDWLKDNKVVQALGLKNHVDGCSPESAEYADAASSNDKARIFVTIQVDRGQVKKVPNTEYYENGVPELSDLKIPTGGVDRYMSINYKFNCGKEVNDFLGKTLPKIKRAGGVVRDESSIRKNIKEQIPSRFAKFFGVTRGKRTLINLSDKRVFEEPVKLGILVRIGEQTNNNDKN